MTKIRNLCARSHTHADFVHVGWICNQSQMMMMMMMAPSCWLRVCAVICHALLFLSVMLVILFVEDGLTIWISVALLLCLYAGERSGRCRIYSRLKSYCPIFDVYTICYEHLPVSAAGKKKLSRKEAAEIFLMWNFVSTASLLMLKITLLRHRRSVDGAARILLRVVRDCRECWGRDRRWLSTVR